MYFSQDLFALKMGFLSPFSIRSITIIAVGLIFSSPRHNVLGESSNHSINKMFTKVLNPTQVAKQSSLSFKDAFFNLTRELMKQNNTSIAELLSNSKHKLANQLNVMKNKLGRFLDTAKNEKSRSIAAYPEANKGTFMDGMMVPMIFVTFAMFLLDIMQRLFPYSGSSPSVSGPHGYSQPNTGPSTEIRFTSLGPLAMLSDLGKGFYKDYKKKKTKKHKAKQLLRDYAYSHSSRKKERKEAPNPDNRFPQSQDGSNEGTDINIDIDYSKLRRGF